MVPELAVENGEGEDSLVEPAPVLVALLGSERSPEMLAELGGALSPDDRTTVVDVQQVHEETMVDAAREDDGRVVSYRRRIEAAGSSIGAEIGFEVLLTRDPPGSLDRLSAGCHWLVMQWRPRERFLLPYNPLGWMLDHIGANVALYRDAGVRYVREMLVATEGDALDPLVIETADHLAEVWGASITVARWLPDGASEDEIQSAQEQLAEATAGCESPAKELLLRGHDEVDAFANESARFDMVLLSRERTPAWRSLAKTRYEAIATASACSVLLLQTPQTRRAPAAE
jgi:hypothetical protein